MNMLPDRQISELVKERMIEPTEERLVRNAQSSRKINRGVFSFGFACGVWG